MLFPEQGYKAKSIANASSLVAWSSNVTATERVEGWCYSDVEVTLELWGLRPQTNADHSAQTSVVLTASLGSDWRLIEGPLTVAAGELEPFDWKVVGRAVRLLCNNASGGAAVVDLEVNSRT